MTSKFFPNHTIASFEDIKNLVETYKQFNFVNNEREEALADIIALVDEYNETLKNDAIATISASENLIDALIPSIVLADNKKKSNDRKRAVYYAVSYDNYSIKTNAEGNHEIRKITRAITLRDIFAYRCNLLAFHHADGKITKDDRTKAMKGIIPTETANALRLFMFGAYRFENVADALRDISAPTCNEDDEKLFITATPSKANAEKQIKRLASALNLDAIPFKRVHALTLYKRAYSLDRMHQAKIVDTLDFLQDFIISARYAKNGIEMPDIIDKGGLFTVDTAPTNADVIIF